MLKLNAAYSKKVPADSQYSSQSYHCSIESELPDGLSPQQLQERIHNAFDLVRQSVEAEIHNGTPVQMPQQQMPVQQTPSQQSVPQTYSAPQTQPIQQQYYDPQGQPQQPQNQQNRQYHQNQNRQYRNNTNASASPKQVNYLLSLVKRAGWTVQQLLQRCNVQAIEQIPSKMCSDLIQEFSGVAA